MSSGWEDVMTTAQNGCQVSWPKQITLLDIGKQLQQDIAKKKVGEKFGLTDAQVYESFLNSMFKYMMCVQEDEEARDAHIKTLPHGMNAKDAMQHFCPVSRAVTLDKYAESEEEDEEEDEEEEDEEEDEEEEEDGSSEESSTTEEESTSEESSSEEEEEDESSVPKEESQPPVASVVNDQKKKQRESDPPMKKRRSE